jgi:hypothetical protein
LPSNLSGRLRVDLSGRHRRDFVADPNHGVPAFPTPSLDPESQATDLRRIPKLGDEAIPFLHGALSDKNVRPSSSTMTVHAIRLIHQAPFQRIQHSVIRQRATKRGGFQVLAARLEWL